MHSSVYNNNFITTIVQLGLFWLTFYFNNNNNNNNDNNNNCSTLVIKFKFMYVSGISLQHMLEFQLAIRCNKVRLSRPISISIQSIQP